MIGRYRSYERAAELLDSLPESVEELAQRPRQADGTARHRRRHGRSHSGNSQDRRLFPAQQAAQEISGNDSSICSTLQSLGPKKVALLWKTFKAGTVEQVEKLAREGKLRDLAGFGEKSEENILKAIEVYKKSAGRFHIDVAEEEADKLVAYIRAFGKPIEAGHAGGLAAARQGNRRRPRPAGHARARETYAPKASKRSRSTSSSFRKSSRCWRTAKTKSASV